MTLMSLPAAPWATTDHFPLRFAVSSSSSLSSSASGVILPQTVGLRLPAKAAAGTSFASKVRPSDLEPDRLRQAARTAFEPCGPTTSTCTRSTGPTTRSRWSRPIARWRSFVAKARFATWESPISASVISTLGAVGPRGSNQVPYSLLWRAVEYEILPRCLASGIGILCYSPLAQGLLTGKFASAGDVPDKRARSRLFSSARP